MIGVGHFSSTGGCLFAKKLKKLEKKSAACPGCDEESLLSPLDGWYRRTDTTTKETLLISLFFCYIFQLCSKATKCTPQRAITPP
jgi:hypothetical protein